MIEVFLKDSESRKLKDVEVLNQFLNTVPLFERENYKESHLSLFSRTIKCQHFSEGQAIFKAGKARTRPRRLALPQALHRADG